MTTTDPRSFGSLFGEIVRDIQQILRGEVRLAKAEAVQEIAKLKTGVVLLGIALVMATLGVAYLLLASVLLIATRLPLWSAALIVGVAVLAIASTCAASGLAAIRKIRGTPRTVQSLKETVRWTT
jgi:integral membrane sensor domain MASE1